MESSCRMEGKFSIVTGANSGIGYETALGLARMGSVVVTVAKDRGRGERARRRIIAASGNPHVYLEIADLSSQRDVRDLAQKYKKRFPRLDVLVNNAGILINTLRKSKDGYELTFATNYLGPFLLTSLLLGILKKSAPSRIVNVSSFAHRFTNDFDFDALDMNQVSSPQSYTQSKLALIMFTYELAKRLEGTGVSVNVLNPGLVRTNVGKDLTGFMKVIAGVSKLFAVSPEKGAQTSIYLASSPEVRGVTGRYFYKSRQKISSKASYRIADWWKLWEISEKLTHTSIEQTAKKSEIIPVTVPYEEYVRH
ncbi:SDR family oxidoreductase [bacterium]|nr:SDR family oxidoreductase [bacterium]